MTRPIGIFVHHQGTGHASRARALAAALAPRRPVTLFTAKPALLGEAASVAGVEVRALPSLFEPRGDEAGAMDHLPTPTTLHCAPLGWPGIREAVATLCAWFHEADPALFISDVSAELAQLARIASVPHAVVVQNGDRSDPGHRAAWDGAAALLAPFHEALAQPGWPAACRSRMAFFPGLGGPPAPQPGRREARRALGLDPDRPLVVLVSGAGGAGMSTAPLGVGARAWPEALWLALGPLADDWHATPPANLVARGWVDSVAVHLVAADLVVSSAGNTLVHQVLAAGVPWLVSPQWCYFDEQLEKARRLDAAGAAVWLPHLPSSAHRWRAAIDRARACHDAATQRRLAGSPLEAASAAARWLEEVVGDLWRPTRPVVRALSRGES